MVSTLDSNMSPIPHSAITIGADGLGLIVYTAAANLRVAHCRDVTCASADISSIAGPGLGPDIALGADGLGLICFKDSDRRLKVAHCSDTACTTASTKTLYTAGDVGEGCSITLGADGLGRISFVDKSSGSLKYARCQDAGCSAATVSTIGSVNLLRPVETAMPSGGVIVYSAQDGLWAAVCTNADCSSATIWRLDSNAAAVPSATLGDDGRPLISYRRVKDGVGDELIVSHCEDHACTSAQRYSLGRMSDSGNSAIIIGPYGLGLIAYHYDDDTVALAVCHDTACSSASINPMVLATQQSGHLSMTSGADDNPLISAFHSNSMRAGHCANPFCTPYFRRR